MNINNYLEYLTNQVHTVVMATTNDLGKPITCAIDIMDFDEYGLYFLTAKGKRIYERLKKNNVISITGLRGRNTLSSKSITVQGVVKEIGSSRIEELFDKNPYMSEIYPTMESRKALTVFQMYQGNGEFFDLSVKPIFRKCFSFGDHTLEKTGLFYINNDCIGCSKCVSVCPQQCIIYEDKRATILQEHCLHCGRCKEVCLYGAIERR